jgi:hypothetical protein
VQLLGKRSFIASVFDESLHRLYGIGFTGFKSAGIMNDQSSVPCFIGDCIPDVVNSASAMQRDSQGPDLSLATENQISQ